MFLKTRWAIAALALPVALIGCSKPEPAQQEGNMISPQQIALATMKANDVDVKEIKGLEPLYSLAPGNYEIELQEQGIIKQCFAAVTKEYFFNGHARPNVLLHSCNENIPSASMPASDILSANRMNVKRVEGLEQMYNLYPGNYEIELSIRGKKQKCMASVTKEHFHNHHAPPNVLLHTCM